MRVRKLTAVVGLAAAMALAMGGLTACDSKVGQAAIVGGHRISESDLGKFLSPAGASPSAISAAAKAGQGVYPKADVVQFLIQEELFKQAMEKNGGVPSKVELAALHDQAGATLLGAQVTGAKLDTELSNALASRGTSAAFLPVVLRTFELEMALVLKVKAQSQAELAAAVNKLRIKVQVNPRYGKWDPKTVSVAAPTSNIPDFLKLNGVTPAATATPSN